MFCLIVQDLLTDNESSPWMAADKKEICWNEFLESNVVVIVDEAGPRLTGMNEMPVIEFGVLAERAVMPFSTAADRKRRRKALAASRRRGV